MELTKNPFYILDLTCEADRAAINAAADELSFFDEDGSVEEAQNALLNPAKRLEAEMDWFPGVTKEMLAGYRKDLENNWVLLLPGNVSDLCKLNQEIYNFRFMEMKEDLIREAVLNLDLLFAKASVKNIRATILLCRMRARMPEVSDNDITRELNRKRSEIRQMITEKLEPLTEEEYVRFVTQLAEKLVRQEENGGVVKDVVDQYEIRMHDEIEQQADRIRERITAIQNAEDPSSSAIDKLIVEVEEWDKLAQPIQLIGQTTGLTHDLSRTLGNELRQLAVYLHNVKQKTEEAAKISKAMQSVFAELTELSATFSKDYEQLEKMVDQKEIVDEVVALKDMCSGTSLLTNRSAIDKRVCELDEKIRKLPNISEEDRRQLRMAVCSVVREAAVQLHNSSNGEYVADAASMMRFLAVHFGSLPEIGKKVQEEAAQLEMLAKLSGRTTPVGTSATVGLSSPADKELKVLPAEYTRDYEKLKSEILKSSVVQKDAAEVINGIEKLRTICDELVSGYSVKGKIQDKNLLYTKQREVEGEAMNLNAKIKLARVGDEKQRERLRTAVCAFVRDTAVRIYLAGEGTEEESACRVAAWILMSTIKNSSSDLPDLGPRVAEEESLLNQMILGGTASRSSRSTATAGTGGTGSASSGVSASTSTSSASSTVSRSSSSRSSRSSADASKIIGWVLGAILFIGTAIASSMH